VLIASGVIDEESYLRALGAELGIDFEPLDDLDRACCPAPNDRLIEAAAAGLLLLGIDGEFVLVLAPRDTLARRICGLISDKPELARRFRFTTRERLSGFVLRSAGDALAARASNALKRGWPALSAAPPRWRRNVAPLATGGFASLAALSLAPAATACAGEILLAFIFLAWLGLRLAGALTDWTWRNDAIDPPDDALPVYTVIAALYHEAHSVEGLLAAIERFNYPREKLDVIIAVEADDHETRGALAARRHRIPLTVVCVPPKGPRTKPKALNVALPFARGSFSVIYDAEDRPEADQLRAALRAFRTGGTRLACVQARLCIDNTADGWLARYFTAEYASQFDAFLPGIAALRLPLPLGGSSNHFRTASLREVGAWDAYNVTEDADLGMRLARFGYRVGMTHSTTYEEAPARIGPWLRQRTRWFKGWMQTWLVHMREPRRLLRDLGPAGFVGFQLVVGGNVLAALVHPLFVAGLAYSLASGTPMLRGDSVAATMLTGLFGTTIAAGYLASAFLGWLGLRQRGLTRSAWVLLLMPLHWLLLALAAWRALYQLITNPYLWEKTEHGLAKTSRRGLRALRRLERHLTKLQEAGLLPASSQCAKNRPRR
jgi:cellulose synthase/poly-beta-1,6-N-acetylglucosamine synthase-like glycosyltransferase